MAMENNPFISDFPIETSIHTGFSIAMFDYQRVTVGVWSISDFPLSWELASHGTESCWAIPGRTATFDYWHHRELSWLITPIT